MSVTIPVNSSILVWARAELNLSVEEVASRMKQEVSVIESWEEGSSSPTYFQLEKLAYEIYKVPLAVFFFSEPPESSKAKISFRTTPDVVYDMISPNVLKIFREAEVMIENLYELNEGRARSNQKRLLEDINVSDVASTARALRQYLGVSIDEQKSWGNSELALKNWREKVTDHGIFIFKDAFKDSDYSGFCLYDTTYPIIYLNSSNAKTRQIFTIFHELWHLLAQTSGIDFIRDEKVINFFDDSAKAIEIQCNRFAAEFLFPTSEFNKIIRSCHASEEAYSDISLEFSVSREVVLRRFFDHKLVSQAEYDTLTAKWNDEMRSNKQTNGGSYYNSEMSYLGDAYLRMAFESYYHNNISSAQLADYLNIKEKNLPNYESYYLRRAAV